MTKQTTIVVIGSLRVKKAGCTWALSQCMCLWSIKKYISIFAKSLILNQHPDASMCSNPSKNLNIKAFSLKWILHD